MNIQTAKIGLEVVRSKGDYVVGRIGKIIEIDEIKNRARVDWNAGIGRTWVNFNSLEDASIPYEIVKDKLGFDPKTGRNIFPKYVRK